MNLWATTEPQAGPFAIDVQVDLCWQQAMPLQCDHIHDTWTKGPHQMPARGRSAVVTVKEHVMY